VAVRVAQGSKQLPGYPQVFHRLCAGYGQLFGAHLKVYMPEQKPLRWPFKKPEISFLHKASTSLSYVAVDS